MNDDFKPVYRHRYLVSCRYCFKELIRGARTPACCIGCKQQRNRNYHLTYKKKPSKVKSPPGSPISDDKLAPSELLVKSRATLPEKLKRAKNAKHRSKLGRVFDKYHSHGTK